MKELSPALLLTLLFSLLSIFNCGKVNSPEPQTGNISPKIEFENNPNRLAKTGGKITLPTIVQERAALMVIRVNHAKGTTEKSATFATGRIILHDIPVGDATVDIEVEDGFGAILYNGSETVIIKAGETAQPTVTLIAEPPLAPIITVKQECSSEIKVTWQNPGGTITRFELFRREQGKTFWNSFAIFENQQLLNSDFVARHSPINSGRTYDYQLLAISDGGTIKQIDSSGIVTHKVIDGLPNCPGGTVTGGPPPPLYHGARQPLEIALQSSNNMVLVKNNATDSGTEVEVIYNSLQEEPSNGLTSFSIKNVQPGIDYMVLGEPNDSNLLLIDGGRPVVADKALFTLSPPQNSPCLNDMANFDFPKTGPYCIDITEDSLSGGASFIQAKESCTNRGKRLCIVDEFEQACNSGAKGIDQRTVFDLSGGFTEWVIGDTTQPALNTYEYTGPGCTDWIDIKPIDRGPKLKRGFRCCKALPPK